MLRICVGLSVMIQTVFGSTVRLTKFHTVHTHNLGNGGILCASRTLNISFIAATLHGTSGDCEGLTWQWGEDKQYLEEYAYIEKKAITEMYTPSLQGEGTTAYLLPFNVGNGNEIEIFFTIHNDTEDLFIVNLADTLDTRFVIGDDVLEYMPAHFGFKRSTEQVVIKSFNGHFTTHENISPFIIPIGSPHKLTIKILTTDIEVCLTVFNLPDIRRQYPPQFPESYECDHQHMSVYTI